MIFNNTQSGLQVCHVKIPTHRFLLPLTHRLLNFDGAGRISLQLSVRVITFTKACNMHFCKLAGASHNCCSSNVWTQAYRCTVYVMLGN
jgi:hypothetical protein